MNTLYEAIMALGRSIDDLKKYGWIQGDLGGLGGPKCATGVVTCAVLGYATYPAPLLRDEGETDELEVIRVMLKALCDVLPPEKKEQVFEIAQNVSTEGANDVRSAINGSRRLVAVETMVVLANDKVIINAKQAIEWFSDALDLLAEQLPVPTSPVVPEAAGAPLVTV